MKKSSLQELLTSGRKSQAAYGEQYAYIMGLIDTGKIKPVKSSPLNGKKPALHTQYHLVEEKQDYSAWEEELLYRTHPCISTDYYRKNMKTYEQERPYVRSLHSFLTDHRERLEIPMSYNERCFEIWGLEKFLSQHGGKTVLKHCGIDLEFLNCYATVEPFACYTNTRELPQNILILENKDPFYSMRQHLMNGNSTILGETIGTLIYGGGKRVVSSFKDFELTAETYMQSEQCRLLYFGDLDYEGIGIYEELVKKTAIGEKIIPFVPAYRAMMDRADILKNLHPTKEEQNRNIDTVFFSHFDDADVKRMKKILEQDLYIPQEILNITDF